MAISISDAAAQDFANAGWGGGSLRDAQMALLRNYFGQSGSIADLRRAYVADQFGIIETMSLADCYYQNYTGGDNIPPLSSKDSIISFMYP